jgi:hypothetical protein
MKLITQEREMPNQMYWMGRINDAIKCEFNITTTLMQPYFHVDVAMCHVSSPMREIGLWKRRYTTSGVPPIVISSGSNFFVRYI